MGFDYDVYFRQDCIVPLLFLLFNLAMGMTLIANGVRTIVKFGLSTFLDNCLQYIIGLIILAILISYLLVPLTRGGYYLLFEKEQDAITLEGVVQETFDNDSFGASRYGFEQNEGHGGGIIINGTRYYVMTYGTIQPGDYVRLKILPKSKFVLEWAILNNWVNSAEALTPEE